MTERFYEYLLQTADEETIRREINLNRGIDMTFTIKKARIEQWGYEITAKGFHNIAPTIETAISYLKDRYGSDVKYIIKEKASK